MARDNDDRPGKDNERPHDGRPGKLREEPTFSHYNEDDEYEESDRDADYTSGYQVDDDIPEEDFDDDYPEEDEPDLFRDEDADNEYDSPDEDDPETWPEEEEPYFEEDQARQQNWPLGLITVAIIALVLLAAGVYGVMQQRAETENELRELRAALATTANPKDVSASRNALKERQQAFETLASETEALRLENRALSDTVAGLQAQLRELRVALTTGAAPKPADSSTGARGDTSPAQVAPQPNPVAPPEPKAEPKPEPKAEPKPKPTPKPRPAPQKADPVVSDTSGPWFVNFGSYAMRNMAESWADRLQPGAGKVVVIPISSDGRTLYRLRVIGLADRETAQQVARKLETDLQVSKLWVGKE